MLFSKNFLLDRMGDDNTVEHKITKHTRWSVWYREVFRFEGKFYQTDWSAGATEMQSESPYEYDPKEIECPEVFPKEKLVTVYERSE